MNQQVLSSPLFWAVMVGWILSVILHEFAHGLVAYLGGDYTIRERGGLSLNPFQYIHPINSIVLPAVFLAMGGIPLPGGATYVRRDLLRNHWWDAAVSLAGPAMNFLLFLACALPLHPQIGWLHPMPGDPIDGAPAVLATLARLQLLAVLINLIPVPPLDGFGAVSAFFSREVRAKFYSPQVVTGCFIVLFIVLFQSPEVMQRFYIANRHVMEFLRFDGVTLEYTREAANTVLFGRTS